MAAAYTIAGAADDKYDGRYERLAAECNGKPVYQQQSGGDGYVLYQPTGRLYWVVGPSGHIADCGTSSYITSSSNAGRARRARTAAAARGGGGRTRAIAARLAFGAMCRPSLSRTGAPRTTRAAASTAAQTAHWLAVAQVLVRVVARARAATRAIGARCHRCRRGWQRRTSYPAP